MNRIRICISIAYLMAALPLWAQSQLELQLFDLCGVSFNKIETAKGFDSSFELKVKQPLDHTDVNKGYFYQKVYLNHKSNDRPTVLVTEGYNRSSNRIYELTEYIDGNQATVEHRYFGVSMPDTMDYRYLTFEQATADLHHINQLLRTIYVGKFLATGISKGGTTTIFYRYFFPDDVDVSVPYVAPLNHELEEKRIYHFLDTVGSEVCRDDIKAFQRRVLEDRDYHLERLSWFAKGRGLTFEYLTFEQAFEYAVLEYPFSFWQWGSECGKVPAATSSKDEDLDHLLLVSGLDFFADESMKQYGSHYYQSGTQMGYYGYEVDDFEGLIQALPLDKNPSAVFMPNKIEGQWDATLTNKVAKWIDKKGHRFIYINGLNDTWSATRVPTSDNVDALWLNMEGQSHGTARIKNMTDIQLGLLQSTLERWLDIKIEK